MKTTLLRSAGGIGLATICGIAGLGHLSATIVTLTMFCAVPALLVLALDALTRVGSPRGLRRTGFRALLQRSYFSP
jgi:hypothetical protein